MLGDKRQPRIIFKQRFSSIATHKQPVGVDIVPLQSTDVNAQRQKSNISTRFSSFKKQTALIAASRAIFEPWSSKSNKSTKNRAEQLWRSKILRSSCAISVHKSLFDDEKSNIVGATLSCLMSTCFAFFVPTLSSFGPEILLRQCDKFRKGNDVCAQATVSF